MWRTIKAVGKRVGSSYSPKPNDVAPEFPDEEYEMRPVQSSRRARGDLGTSSGNGRRRRIGYDEPEPEIDGETVPQPSTSGRIFGSRRRGDGDGARAPAEASWEDGRDPGGSGRARDRSGRGERGRDGAERERTRERERDKSSGRRRDAPRGDAPPEETRLLPNGARPARWRWRNGLAQNDPGGSEGDWRLGSQGYGAVEVNMLPAPAAREEEPTFINPFAFESSDEEAVPLDPASRQAYERSIRVLRITALREYYDSRRRNANILLLGTCALDPALRVGLSVGPNRGISTLLTPAPWFNAGWAAAYLACLLYALFQALPAESGRPLLRRIGWLSALMFATDSAASFASSMLTLSSGTLQHFADIWPGLVVSHVGGASPVSWTMVFVSILSLLPSGLVLQSLVSPYNCQWSVEDHILIAAPLSIWSAWITLGVGEDLAVALLSSGIYQLGLGNLSGSGPAVLILLALTAFACGLIVTGEGNPYFSITIVWGLMGIAQQAEANFSSLNAVTVTAVLMGVVVMYVCTQCMKAKAASQNINRWGEVVPLAMQWWFQMREADARGETMRDVMMTVSHAASRMKLIALRFKELISGAVASVSA